MAVIFGGDAGVREDYTEDFVGKISREFDRIKEGITENFNRLSGKSVGTPTPPQKESVFVDSGFSNVPGTAFVGSTIDNVDDVQMRRITTQEPQLTVYIKKRAFWSLRAENDTRFMDNGEKLYLRATKILFEKKCSQLAAYEALTKLSKLVSEESEFDALPIDQTRELLRDFNRNIVDVAKDDKITANAAPGSNAVAAVLRQQEVEKLTTSISDLENLLEVMQEVADRVRKTAHATQTNWVVDNNDTDVINIGRGSGVIELTLVSDMNSSLSIEGDEGSVSFTVQDPYNLTKISTDDVETALSAALKEQSDIERKFEDLFNGIGTVDSLIGGANRGPAAVLEKVRETDDELKKLRKNKVANNFGLGQNAAPLTTSDATEIIFEINPTSLASNKVIGSVASIPEPFNKNNFRIALGQLPIEERLGIEEDRLVTRIFNLLDIYVAQVEALNQSIKDNNKNEDVRYARRQLRVHYLGKSIVQPMDGIHMYIRGKTRKPDEIIGPLNALLNNNSFVKLFSDDDDVNNAIIKEEMKQFGLAELNLSEDHYKALRSSSMLRNAGMHVFGGLVSNVTESYSSGVYVLNVSGHSNLKWLRLSRVNVRPSLDQTQGVLEDPLTPFDIKTDPATGLIEKEPELILINKLRLGILNHNQTQHAGKKMTESDVADYVDDGSGGEPQKVFAHVPGLAYKWKQGVMVATRNVNLKTALDGSPNQLAKLRREVGMTITETPFANLDAADVVSLLVTGVPHNYESFFENARVTGSYNDNVQNNSPQSYFHSFFDIQRSTNRALGNFHPFKQYDVDQKQLSDRLKIQSDLRNDSSELRTLRKELAELQDELSAIDVSLERAPNPDDALANSIQLTIESIVKSIQIKKDEITSRVVAFKKSVDRGVDNGLRIYGNDIALDSEIGSITSEIDAVTERRKNIQLSNKLLQMRTQFNCKFNNDKNLFIVADEYDKDLDIQAFILNSIGSQELPLWNSDYAVPLETCQKVAKTLDFEFFCMSEDTVVLTMNNNGEIRSKLIRDFVDGDKVIAIDQSTKEICWKPAKLSKRKLRSCEKMFAIRDGQGNVLKLSDGHRLLDSNLNEVFVRDLVPGTRLGTAASLPNIEEDVYIDINELFINHKWYIDNGDTFRIGGQGSKCKDIPKTIKLDEDISWLLGMYIAEGSVSDPDNRNNKKFRGFHTAFALNYNERGIANRIADIISDKFNIISNIYMYKKYGRCTVDVGSFVFSTVIKNIFGRTFSKNKRIPSIIWRTSSVNKISCLAGIFMGDGTYNRRLTLTSISKYLINDVSQLLLMLGIRSKIDMYNKLHIYGKDNINILLDSLNGWHHYPAIVKYCSTLNSFDNRKKTDCCAVKDIREIYYNGLVYDLEVEGFHTFLLGSTWSHNCDTQGHIRFKPPTYNKVPLSLLLKLFILDDTEGKQLFPSFLRDLFNTRSKTLNEDINIIDNEIEIEAILLNISLDSVVRSVGLQIQERVISATESEALDGQFKLTATAATVSKAKDLIDARNRLATKIGGKTLDDEVQKNITNATNELSALNNPSSPNVNSSRLSHINRVSQLVSRRQRLAAESSKLAQQGSAVNKKGTSRIGSDVKKKLFGTFGNLVADDLHDFLGPGSASRFIIHDDQIIDYKFVEADDNVICRVNVTGQQDLTGDRPGELGGIPVLWAGGTDFDLWRQYGYRPLQEHQKPFFKNAEAQCAPYVLFLLSRARRDIVRGTITLYGNEYYQLGDVVYINSRDMLYYVAGISHNFSYSGGTFTTTLTLRYGHPLGEYIPTPLDVIGKSLIRNQRRFNNVVTSRETADPVRGITIGVVAFPPQDSGDAKADMLGGPFSLYNILELKNALEVANVHIRNDPKIAFPKIELRSYITEDEDSDSSIVSTGRSSTTAINRMRAVRGWLMNPTGRRFRGNKDKYITLGPRFTEIKLSDKKISTINSEIDPVNIKEELTGENLDRLRIPSEEAFNVSINSDAVGVVEVVLLLEEG